MNDLRLLPTSAALLQQPNPEIDVQNCIGSLRSLPEFPRDFMANSGEGSLTTHPKGEIHLGSDYIFGLIVQRVLSCLAVSKGKLVIAVES